MLDWESADCDGLPLLDLGYFTVNSVLIVNDALGNGAEGRVYRPHMEGDHALGTVGQTALAQYLRALSVPADAAQPLLTFAWALHAIGSRIHGCRRNRHG